MATQNRAPRKIDFFLAYWEAYATQRAYHKTLRPIYRA